MREVKFKYMIHQLLASPQIWSGVTAKHAWISAFFLSLFLLYCFWNPVLYSRENTVILLTCYTFCMILWYSLFILAPVSPTNLYCQPAENTASFAQNGQEFISIHLPSVVKHSGNKTRHLFIFFASEENLWPASIFLAFSLLAFSLWHSVNSWLQHNIQH